MTSAPSPPSHTPVGEGKAELAAMPAGRRKGSDRDFSIVRNVTLTRWQRPSLPACHLGKCQLPSLLWASIWLGDSFCFPTKNGNFLNKVFHFPTALDE